MSTSSVVRLDDYRGRRHTRLRRMLALHRPDPNRLRLVERLHDALATLDADRAAVVWLDEYGDGLPHVHCLLDLLADVPRGRFHAPALRAAWEAGIPGFLDAPDASGYRGGEDGPRSLAVVALGSDGARAWFLVVDSVVPRGTMSRKERENLLFIAGECASVVLHRVPEDPAEKDAKNAAFPGWAVLEDLEGHEADKALGRRISSRFLVTRLVSGLVDDDLAIDPESLQYQVEGVRRELHSLPSGDGEEAAWHRLLDALEAGRWTELASAVLDLATDVERQDHLSGALELYGIAYRLSAACASSLVALDAARLTGRTLRRLARWDEATTWYGFARDIARSAGEPGREAVVLDGLASTLRDLGNLPRARELLQIALELAEQADDAYALGSAHHSLAVIEKLMGRLDRAIVHGWTAVRLHESGEFWLAALTDLAGVFVETGEYQAAEDAYSIVLGASPRFVYRAYALDALAYISALQGRRDEFHRRAAVADATGWIKPDTAPAMRAEFSYFRGKSYQALGDVESARAWFGRAARLAEEHRLNKFYFDATRALADCDTGRAPMPGRAHGDVPASMPAIRRELSAMRTVVAGSPG